MRIEFDLKGIDGSDLEDEKLELLMATLGVQETDRLVSAVTKLTQAGISEYIEMLAGKGMPNRADETKQDRLLYLIKHFFTPHLPVVISL